MPELDPFDARLRAGVRSFADRALTSVDAAATADAALAPLHAALATAQDTATRAESIRAEAFRAEAARTAAARRKELTDRLTESRSLTERRAPLARAATAGPEAKDIANLSQLAQEAEVQRALHDRSAPHVRFHHSGPARALQDGSPVPDAALPIHAETRFDLPGFGHVLVTPGASTDSGALQRAEAALGDGGAVVSNDEGLLARLRMLRDGGRLGDQIARNQCGRICGIHRLEVDVALYVAAPEQAYQFQFIERFNAFRRGVHVQRFGQ